MTLSSQYHSLRLPKMIKELAALTDDFNQLIQQVNRQKQELKALSVTDHLTGLMNRRALTQGLDHAVHRAHRFGYPLAVIILDVDYFKSFNDHYGHLEGDKVLKAIAMELANHFSRDADLVARYGGEEFMVVLENTEFPECVDFCQAYLQRVRDLPIEHAHSLARSGLSVSAGLVFAAKVGSDIQPGALIQAADEALYQAKDQGRDRLVSVKYQGQH